MIAPRYRTGYGYGYWYVYQLDRDHWPVQSFHRGNDPDLGPIEYASDRQG